MVSRPRTSWVGSESAISMLRSYVCLHLTPLVSTRTHAHTHTHTHTVSLWHYDTPLNNYLHFLHTQIPGHLLWRRDFNLRSRRVIHRRVFGNPCRFHDSYEVRRVIHRPGRVKNRTALHGQCVGPLAVRVHNGANLQPAGDYGPNYQTCQCTLK